MRCENAPVRESRPVLLHAESTRPAKRLRLEPGIQTKVLEKKQLFPLCSAAGTKIVTFAYLCASVLAGRGEGEEVDAREVILDQRVHLPPKDFALQLMESELC